MDCVIDVNIHNGNNTIIPFKYHISAIIVNKECTSSLLQYAEDVMTLLYNNKHTMKCFTYDKNIEQYFAPTCTNEFEMCARYFIQQVQVQLCNKATALVDNPAFLLLLNIEQFYFVYKIYNCETNMYKYIGIASIE